MQDLRPGDRVRLIDMPNDPDPIPRDSLGTVPYVRQNGAGQSAWFQVEVEWDSDIRLTLGVYTHVKLNDRTIAMGVLPGTPMGKNVFDEWREDSFSGVIGWFFDRFADSDFAP